MPKQTKPKNLRDYPKEIIIQWIEKHYWLPLITDAEFAQLDFLVWQQRSAALLKKARELTEEKAKIPGGLNSSAQNMADWWRLENELTKVYKQLKKINEIHDED